MTRLLAQSFYTMGWPSAVAICAICIGVVGLAWAFSFSDVKFWRNTKGGDK